MNRITLFMIIVTGCIGLILGWRSSGPSPVASASAASDGEQAPPGPEALSIKRAPFRKNDLRDLVRNVPTNGRRIERPTQLDRPGDSPRIAERRKRFDALLTDFLERAELNAEQTQDFYCMLLDYQERSRILGDEKYDLLMRASLEKTRATQLGLVPEDEHLREGAASMGADTVALWDEARASAREILSAEQFDLYRRTFQVGLESLRGTPYFEYTVGE